jgi:hypothetical protein
MLEVRSYVQSAAKAREKIVPLADSAERREPVSDINMVAADIQFEGA